MDMSVCASAYPYKNHKGREEMGIFVGFEPNTFPGYQQIMLYRFKIIGGALPPIRRADGAASVATASALHPGVQRRATAQPISHK